MATSRGLRFMSVMRWCVSVSVTLKATATPVTSMGAYAYVRCAGDAAISSGVTGDELSPTSTLPLRKSRLPAGDEISV